MENTTKPTLSDVERNKELFEYEMTEVILQLKGEFAKVSGKDMHLDDVTFAAPKMDIQADIKEVSVDPITVEAINTNVNVSAAVSALQKTAVGTVDVECPAVPTMTRPEIGTVEIKSIGLDVETVKFKACEIPAVSVTPTAVETVPGEIRLPDLIGEVHMDPIKVDTVNTDINLPAFESNVTVDHIAVEVPDTEMKLGVIKPAAAVKLSPDVPAIPSVGAVNLTEVQLSVPSEISVPGRISAVKLQEVELHASALPDVPVVTPVAFTPAEVSAAAPEINTIEVPKIGKVSAPQITLDPISVDVPAAAKIKPFEKAALSKPQDGTSQIQFDYPTVSPVTIPPVQVVEPKPVAVPDMLDTEAFMKKIVGSAV
ncbi:MAG: hypothetical protein K5695_09535 [Oscillospiraceae bacterium]|nr:hypothetical protein [Oscillospiraceae bacterium]